MGYQQYGISPQLVERIKTKMKNPAVKERIKKLIDGVTKSDLQDKAKVRRLVKSSAVILNENFSTTQEEQFVAFVLAQKIDPNNTFHLIKLWGMFR
ncbi:stage VI sporulation protein F [Paenibacillus taichungensis]|uniref:Serine/threonine protein kinase n=3 Tax=Paenibacillus TaxID=44249 RepID=A0A0N0UGN9_9BACL|nr:MULTISPECIES: stage VI sporulation protein F [Paenibacillus]KOY12707.1 serine/threonine protein kinase [Paenibacillus xylanivorans]MDR9746996.1 stage VI sporulation protein F [Paenibacillus taichungensis]MEC0108187.1 stage VI sporulation protein F [Paenibacillus taichungensis]MEC0199767.1 stage VI sporulation protein F [Paenibacillus taichungensis]NEU60548.1 serine/threonine protein kinase [Paenibacillus sp. ALJ109b]